MQFAVSIPQNSSVAREAFAPLPPSPENIWCLDKHKFAKNTHVCECSKETLFNVCSWPATNGAVLQILRGHVATHRTPFISCFIGSFPPPPPPPLSKKRPWLRHCLRTITQLITPKINGYQAKIQTERRYAHARMKMWSLPSSL